MKRKINIIGLALPVFFYLFIPVNLQAEKGKSVDEIVNNTNKTSYYQGKDGRAMVNMTIIDSQGRKRIRRFTILRSDEPPSKDKTIKADSYCKDQWFYVYFHYPADVKKMSFLVWKHVDKDDDRWIYLPALDLVKRISSTEKRTSFVGSHFFYEDVSGRNIDENRHELIKTTENYYVLKNTPKKPETVEFSYYNMWIHKEKFIPVKVEYFDKNSEKYREYEALKVEKINGYHTVTQAKMKDLRNNGETIIKYNKVKYNINLPKEVFTERSLRRPPYKYLKGR